MASPGKSSKAGRARLLCWRLEGAMLRGIVAASKAKGKTWKKILRFILSPDSCLLISFSLSMRMILIMVLH